MARVLASFFGTGLILRRIRGGDAGSGTVAGIFALALSIWVGRFGVVWSIGLAVMLTITSLLSVRRFAADEGDPGWVVIDEAAGTAIAVIGLSPTVAVIAFVVFRIADIQKEWFPGVAMAERRLPGAIGVTTDDVIAGLYGLVAGSIIQALLAG